MTPDQITTLLDLLGAPAHLELLSERQDLLRFGASRITYQHSEQRLRLRARLLRDGRAAWGTLETLDPSAVRALRARLEALMARLPPLDEAALALALTPPPAAGVLQTAQTCFPATVAAGAEDRAAALAALARALPQATLGGSITHGVTRQVVANTAGLLRDETRTRAALQVVAAQDGATSFARLLHRHASAVTAARAAAAVAPGLAPLPMGSLEPGSYRAVLSPYVVGALIALYTQLALGAGEYLAGDSACSGRLGQPVTSPLLTLHDDGAAAAGLPATFDCQGIAKQRVPLVEAGVLRGLVHDRRTAALAGVPSTGHAVPPGWRFGAGPCPSHLVLSPAAAALTPPELDAACERGLSVQRVDYVRVLHPKQTLVTGTTRDATCWIEGGRAVARVPQFRFTLRLSDLFSSVLALGADPLCTDTVFMESVVAPSALIPTLPVHTVI